MYEEYNEFDKGFPIIDKTDWRSKIRDALWNCIKNAGWYPEFIYHVDGLILTFSAEYPGFDAKEKVESKLFEVKKKYKELYRQWLVDNSTVRYWIKKKTREDFDMKLNLEMFEFIKNLYARKRGLLYGIKKGHGGKPMSDGTPDESQDMGE